MKLTRFVFQYLYLRVLWRRLTEVYLQGHTLLLNLKTEVILVFFSLNRYPQLAQVVDPLKPKSLSSGKGICGGGRAGLDSAQVLADPG